MARPVQAVLLTGLPRAWEAVHAVMERFRRTLTRRGVEGEFAYHVEANPDDEYAAHIHLWWRGGMLKLPFWREVAARSGMGTYVGLRVAHAETRHHSIPTIDYGLKAILLRPTNPTSLWPSAEEYMTLNGKRLLHSTNGFFEDWHGQPLTVRAARSIAHRWGRSDSWRYQAVQA